MAMSKLCKVTFFLIFLHIFSKTNSDLIITGSGVKSFQDDDMALIFYITLRNTCDRSFEILVHMIECCLDIKPIPRKDCKSMRLLGGNMGMIDTQEYKNVTLIYPNLYLYDRKGTCKVAINYRDQYGSREMLKDICFHTRIKPGTPICDTDDLQADKRCSPADCTEKYSGWKSFFNYKFDICEEVPECLSHKAYSTITNRCINLKKQVYKKDLEKMEKQKGIETYHSLLNLACHHGSRNEENECECFEGWATTPNDCDFYEPRLAIYHMCNVDIGTWQSVNKRRMFRTILIIAILVFTFTSKVLILLCFLNWCYKYIKPPFKKDDCDCEPSITNQSRQSLTVMREENYILTESDSFRQKNTHSDTPMEHLPDYLSQLSRQYKKGHSCPSVPYKSIKQNDYLKRANEFNKEIKKIYYNEYIRSESAGSESKNHSRSRNVIKMNSSRSNDIYVKNCEEEEENEEETDEEEEENEEQTTDNGNEDEEESYSVEQISRNFEMTDDSEEPYVIEKEFEVESNTLSAYTNSQYELEEITEEEEKISEDKSLVRVEEQETVDEEPVCPMSR